MIGKDLRRTVTLSQQLATPESPVDPLMTRHATGHWDGATIRTASGRTLFDVIQQDDNWKPVKDKLRLQRVGSALSCTASDNVEVQPAVTVDEGSQKLSGGAPSIKRKPTLARTFSRSVTIQPVLLGPSGLPSPTGEIVITEITEVTDEMPDEPEPIKTKEEEPSKGGISLMDLLEQTTDNKWSNNEEEAEETENHHEEEEEETESDQEMIHTCCICMVKHKGAAFEQCGHTFCRLCSRELWVSSGNCPLCNGFVQEILDIF